MGAEVECIQIVQGCKWVIFVIEEKGCEMLEKNSKRYRTALFGHYGNKGST